MSRSMQRLIPKESVSRSSMHTLAKFNPWFLSEKIERDSDNTVPFELIWITSDEKTTIHYIEDELVDFPYIVVKGENVENIVSRISSQIELFSDKEIFQNFEDSTDRIAKMRAVARLGIASPQSFDSRFFELLESAFADSDPEVRRTAVWCIGYASWKEFRATLERLIASDPEESIREDASYLLESYNQHNIY